VDNPDILHCIFDLNGKTAGSYDLTVTNPDGQKATSEKVFTVKQPPSITAPTIKGISPNEGVNTGVVRAFIDGTNLQAGAQAILIFGTTTIKGENIKVENGISLSCLFDLTVKPAGNYDLTVTNPDEQNAALEKAFTVKEIKVTYTELNQQMPNIHFDTNKTAIRPDQISILNANLVILKAHPELQIILRGHADPRGNKFNNMELSLKRVEAVKAYLVRQGIDPQRIKLEAYGSDRLLQQGNNETAWAVNRRVETLLVEFKPEETVPKGVDQ
jgi:outer membrane protein OmpA-like peptidoglycan-associated protein